MSTINSRDVQRNIIIHPNGAITLLGETDERSSVDEEGGVQGTTTTLRIATRDGHVLRNGDIALQCTNCQTGPWSRNAMTTCAACRRLVCIPCAHQHPVGILCTPCHKAVRKAVLRAWLWSIV